MFNDAPVRLQMRARRKDASTADVELSIGMVHGVEGRLTHWVLAFADRGEIARMHEELRGPPRNLRRALGENRR
jgi:hypothetical protein